jgi:hypothetical protein
MTNQPKSLENIKEKAATIEYNRLIKIYKVANVDTVKLDINNSLIKKVAEVFGILESIKNLPTIVYDPQNTHRQQETAAGRMRVKLMAQYSGAMQKLNKELLGVIDPAEDDGLEEFKEE